MDSIRTYRWSIEILNYNTLHTSVLLLVNIENNDAARSIIPRLHVVEGGGCCRRWHHTTPTHFSYLPSVQLLYIY